MTWRPLHCSIVLCCGCVVFTRIMLYQITTWKQLLYCWVDVYCSSLQLKVDKAVLFDKLNTALRYYEMWESNTHKLFKEIRVICKFMHYLTKKYTLLFQIFNYVSISIFQKEKFIKLPLYNVFSHLINTNFFYG